MATLGEGHAERDAFSLLKHVRNVDPTHLDRFELLRQHQTILHVLNTIPYTTENSLQIDELQAMDVEVREKLKEAKKKPALKEKDQLIFGSIQVEAPVFPEESAAETAGSLPEGGVTGVEDIEEKSNRLPGSGKTNVADISREDKDALVPLPQPANEQAVKAERPQPLIIKFSLKTTRPLTSKIVDGGSLAFQVGGKLSLGEEFNNATQVLQRRSHGSVGADRDRLLSRNTDHKNSHLLEHHATQQNEIVSALSGMSSRLKENSLHFAQSLQRDRDVLEKLDTTLSDNHGNLKEESKRLNAVSRKSRATTCMTFSLVFTVLTLWIVFFIIIRIT